MSPEYLGTRGAYYSRYNWHPTMCVVCSSIRGQYYYSSYYYHDQNIHTHAEEA